ncbi:MAG: lipoprotein insertase outer membrane protein LolB [Pseudomonadales bacterium]
MRTALLATRSAARLLLILLLLTLAACAPLAQRATQIDSLSRLPETWRCQGKLALRAERADGSSESQVLRFRLEQHGEDFTLQLSGLFGLGAAVIEQRGGVVTLQRGPALLEQADSSEALLLQLTGLDLPVSLLRYWLAGRPGPREIARVERRHASGFEQAGWTVSYLALAEYAGNTLPRKIRATGSPGSVTIVVADWQL